MDNFISNTKNEKDLNDVLMTNRKIWSISPPPCGAGGVTREDERNLGADDDENTGKCTGNCTMENSAYQYWCSYCENLIRTRIQNGGI